MSVMTWAMKRQIIYSIGAMTLIAFIVTLIVVINKPIATCTDGIQNQLEIDIDCGGPCSAVCNREVTDLITIWTKAIEVNPGVYDLAAFIENPNIRFGIKELSYHFQVFDSTNTKILEREGTTFVNPNERFAIFEGAVSFTREPKSVFIEFDQITWKRVTDQLKLQQPDITIRNEVLQPDLSKPKLTVTAFNKSSFRYEDVDVKALVYNRENNAVAVSSSFIKDFKRDEQQTLVFTWRAPFPEGAQICKIPVDVILAFDRSGSMNDDNDNPPQPITAAKRAAQTFVESLTSDVDQVGLVTFATNASDPIDQQLDTNLELVGDKVRGISILPADEVGSTNLGEAIDAARLELNSNRHIQGSSRVMIILTDGKANAPKDPGGEEFAQVKAELARDTGITIYSIGLGDAVNTEFLQENISGDASRYYGAATTDELVGIYSQIAEAICPDKTYITNILVRVNNVAD